MTITLEPWLTKNELRRRLGPVVGRFCGEPDCTHSLHPDTLAKFEDEGLPSFVPPGKTGRRYLWTVVTAWLITFSASQITQMDMESRCRRRRAS